MAIAGVLVLASLVLLTFADVILCYFYSDPLRGRQDIIEIGMVLSLLLAAPYTWWVNGHISVDLYASLSLFALEKLRVWLIKLSVARVFCLIAYRAWWAAEDAALFNEATNMIGISHKPFIPAIMAMSCFHAAMIMLECFLSSYNPNDLDYDE